MSLAIVTTIGQKCKRCYSCVRECPAIAIKVVEGQAVVINERCINCGHCVKVCSQNAKSVKSDVSIVLNEILNSNKAIAMIAPSFPASFPNNYSKVVSGLKLLGFKLVTEAAFGADLISNYYKDLYQNSDKQTIISSPCPAIYNLIEKYYEPLVNQLATIVSPMIAMGRYLKSNYGNDSKVVFIGPCVAKKSEYVDEEVNDAVDAVLTFNEIKELFEAKNINLENLDDSNFDPPHAFIGKSFPLVGGLLKTANISEDVLEKDIIVVEGKNKVKEILEEIYAGNIKSKFVDILFCEGCINGPAIDSDLNYYSKREKVITFINENINSFDKREWQSNIFNSRFLDLNRKFTYKPQRKPTPTEDEIKTILARTNKYSKSDELNCGSCGYNTCRDYAIAIAKGLAEDDMCLPYLIDKLEKANQEIQDAHEQLHSAEKLASIGQLAAGVAHEINNPLGSIILYASLLKRKLEKANCSAEQNLEIQTIVDEANRCKSIVSNLLNFARQNKLRLSKFNLYETIKSVADTIKINPDYYDVELIIKNEIENTIIEGDEDQIKQVFINVINNAVESLENSNKKEVSITIKNNSNEFIIEISDTGCGISNENISKIFTPFFTTKKIGKGTGLGLAISYGIIKMHKGDIKVKSTLNLGTTFTIKLPINQNKNVIMN
ncbi:MAG: ATP-binding protein [Melioribacteraceae bacterium]|nr:ATP-binding protein [Melioribacteraceae bacterium]